MARRWYLNPERAARYVRHHGRTPPWKRMDTTTYLMQDKRLRRAVAELKAQQVI